MDIHSYPWQARRFSVEVPRFETLVVMILGRHAASKHYWTQFGRLYSQLTWWIDSVQNMKAFVCDNVPRSALAYVKASGSQLQSCSGDDVVRPALRRLQAIILPAGIDDNNGPESMSASAGGKLCLSACRQTQNGGLVISSGRACSMPSVVEGGVCYWLKNAIKLDYSLCLCVAGRSRRVATTAAVEANCSLAHHHHACTTRRWSILAVSHGPINFDAENLPKCTLNRSSFNFKYA